MSRSFSWRYLLFFISISPSLHASFIEQTLGTAVVKDATAVFFNPSALTNVAKPQFIFLGTLAQSEFQFSGSVQRVPLNVMESGSTSTKSNFSLPSLYASLPLNDKFFVGFAVVANDFDKELDNHSVLRYVQARNQTDDMDLVPAIGVKINESFSIGGNLNISHAHMVQEPISGIPSINIPEGRSLNDSKATSLGGDFGLLLKLAHKTALGFNYRSAITYHLNGTSLITAPQVIYSDDYHFKFWTPARTVVSLSHFFNEKIGLIGTVQYLQWDIFKNAYVYNFASQSNNRAFIVPKARINYDFHNSWLVTLGSIYNATTKWKIRVAATYNQSPSNGTYQISTGDSLITGFSTGYELLDQFMVDFSYGHAFFRKQSINIWTSQNIINGVNKGVHDAVSLKFTLTG